MHRGQIIIFDEDGEEIEINATDNTTSAFEVLLIACKPLNDPIARYGPFVTNRREKIMEAIVDYQNGAMGKIMFNKDSQEKKNEDANKNENLVD